METNIFSICDFAQENNGKLTLVGTFDTVFASSMPAALTSCWIVSRLVITKEEKGNHQLKYEILDPTNNIIQMLEADLNIPVENKKYGHGNFLANIINLQFQVEGQYKVALYCDNNLVSSIPLTVTIKV